MASAISTPMGSGLDDDGDASMLLAPATPTSSTDPDMKTYLSQESPEKMLKPATESFSDCDNKTTRAEVEAALTSWQKDELDAGYKIMDVLLRLVVFEGVDERNREVQELCMALSGLIAQHVYRCSAMAPHRIMIIPKCTRCSNYAVVPGTVDRNVCIQALGERLFPVGVSNLIKTCQEGKVVTHLMNILRAGGHLKQKVLQDMAENDMALAAYWAGVHTPDPVPSAVPVPPAALKRKALAEDGGGEENEEEDTERPAKSRKKSQTQKPAASTGRRTKSKK